MATKAKGPRGDWPAATAPSAPISGPPRNNFRVGLNHLSHHDEGQRQGSSMTEFPVIFTKSWTTINALGGDIVVDQRATQKADWEAELGVVIGAGGANIFEADAIGYLSEGMALLPGDVILTGTAAGVGVWRQPHEFLTDGDVVEISCAGLGTLSNRVVERGA